MDRKQSVFLSCLYGNEVLKCHNFPKTHPNLISYGLFESQSEVEHIPILKLSIFLDGTEAVVLEQSNFPKLITLKFFLAVSIFVLRIESEI